MIIKDVLDDGTVIKEYLENDRIKIIYSDSLFMDKGDLGTVLGPGESNYTYEIETDSMKKSGWGSKDDVPGEHIEPAGVTKAGMPRLIKEWKETKIKELIGIKDA